MIKLPFAPQQYSPRDQNRVRQSIEELTTAAFKRGEDLELARGERLVLRDANGVRWQLTVSTLGVLSVSAYP